MEPLKSFVRAPSSSRWRTWNTDQIIPARFLTTTKDGLVSGCSPIGATFRRLAQSRLHLESTLRKGCQVLVAGRNFGCGSSREHAPWALVDYGIRA